MNKFELEMAKVKQERDAKLLRIDSNMAGIRRDCDCRIRKLMFEYAERLHKMENEWLDLKLRINNISDMQARFGLMDRLHRLENEQSYQRKRRDIDLKTERDELNVRIQEVSVERRCVKLEAARRLMEIQERYQHWLDTTQKIVCNEEV